MVGDIKDAKTHAKFGKYYQIHAKSKICKYKMQIPLKYVKCVKYLPCICLRTTWV